MPKAKELKIVQIAVYPETEADYARLFALTAGGDVFSLSLNGNDNTNWRGVLPLDEDTIDP